MVWATCVPQAVVISMTTSVKFSHTVFNVPLLGLNNCSDLLQSRDLWPRTSYLNSACFKNKIPLASVHDEQIRTTKSRNDFNYSSSEFFDVTNAFRLMSFLLRMLLREFSGERCKKASVEIGLMASLLSLNGHMSSHFDIIHLKLSTHAYFAVPFHVMWSKYENSKNRFL